MWLREVTDECDVPSRGDGRNRAHGEDDRLSRAKRHGGSLVLEPSLQPVTEG